MARKSGEKGINKKKFIEACQEMGNEKGIGEESLLDALTESFRVTFAKKIEQEYRLDSRSGKPSKNKDKNNVKLPDALIRSEIDLSKGKVDCFHRWEVVNDDDVTDDYIQIGLTDARAKNPKLNVGDFYEEPLDLNTLNMGDVGRFISCFKQKISKAEKDALLDAFASKIGTIVTGEVDKSDSHCVIVNLGRTTATLFQNDLIGDEKFQQGDSIKVYVEGIGKDDKKGSLIKISRSCPGFLRKLFENEIHEIYDGTVIIKDVARIAGKRSKVAVYSKDPNVDPSGACIGQNGSRIQAIVSQLGNAKDSKEKIDVVTYNPNLGLYVAELLKPGKVLGMNIDEENKVITVVCENETGTLAIGFKGTNAILARKLTGYKLDIIEEDEANEKGITYKTLSEFEVEAREDERKRFRERQEELNKNKTEDTTPVNDENEMFSAKDEDEELEEDISSNIEEMPAEETTTEEVKEEKPVEEKPYVAPKKEKPEVTYNDAPVYKKEEAPIEHSEVKTTTTLESLEKSLAEEKKVNENKASKKKYKKEDKKQDFIDEDDEIETRPVHKMDIYTDEELQQLDAELDDDIDSYDDEDDYSDYDSDDYYEDK